MIQIELAWSSTTCDVWPRGDDNINFGPLTCSPGFDLDRERRGISGAERPTCSVAPRPSAWVWIHQGVPVSDWAMGVHVLGSSAQISSFV